MNSIANDSMYRPSLCVATWVVPVVASWRSAIEETLEVIGDLTSTVEFWLCADESREESTILARELATYYRQVYWLSTPRGGGPELAKQLILRRSLADVVMWFDGLKRPSAGDFLRAWQRCQGSASTAVHHVSMANLDILRSGDTSQVAAANRGKGVEPITIYRADRPDRADSLRHSAAFPWSALVDTDQPMPT